MIDYRGSDFIRAEGVTKDDDYVSAIRSDQISIQFTIREGLRTVLVVVTVNS